MSAIISLSQTGPAFQLMSDLRAAQRPWDASIESKSYLIWGFRTSLQLLLTANHFLDSLNSSFNKYSEVYSTPDELFNRSSLNIRNTYLLLNIEIVSVD